MKYVDALAITYFDEDGSGSLNEKERANMQRVLALGEDTATDEQLKVINQMRMARLLSANVARQDRKKQSLRKGGKFNFV